jgi:hypothetical protein
LFVAAPLVFVGCGSSSETKDAAPASNDAHTTPAKDAGPDLVVSADAAVVPPDTAPDTLVPAGDVGPAVLLDAAPDMLVPAGDVGPAVLLDAAPDTLVSTFDAGPSAPPDGATDALRPPADLAPAGNPDLPADKAAAPGETGPAITPDATGDSTVDGGEVGLVVATDAAGGQADGVVPDGGASPDSSGPAADVACGTFVGGPVTSDLTLTKACSPYVISAQIQVNGGAVLTIDPGVTLKFAEVVGIDVGSHDAAKLVAVGTATDPIVFTSGASLPLAGDWSAIRFLDGTAAGSKIAYAKLDYCGSDRNGCIVGDGLAADIVALDHLTVGHVGQDSDGILEYDADSNFIITNSTFSDIADGQYAISVQAPSFAGIGTSNTFNGGAMIQVFGGTVSSTTSWLDPGTTVAVTDSLFVDGTTNPVLTLGSGLTLKIAPKTPALEFSIGYSMGGTLVVAGTSANRVVVTSLADIPNQGDWVGVEVWAKGAAQISYANISYAGSDAAGGGNIILENANSAASLAVDHTALTYSLGYGIYLACADTTVTTPLATVTLGAGNTYSFNDMDLSLANTQAANVGPGLTCPGL